MKKLLTSLFLAICLICPCMAAENESVLSVSSTFEKDYTPDTAKVSLSLTNSGMSIKDIKEKNDKTIVEVMALIKKELGQNETIKTTKYSVNPVYSYKNNARVFQRYEVTNGFEVKLKDVTKISNIIKIATDNGIKNVGDIRFYIEDKEKISNEAIQEAIKMAKARANVISSAAGVQILKIKSINVRTSLDNSYSAVRYLASSNLMYKSMDAAASETVSQPIEAGDIRVNATANIDYYLK